MCYHSFCNITEGCRPLQDDLICLPPKVAAPLGNMGPVVFCSRVTNTVQLTDPLTLRTVPLEVSGAVPETGTRRLKPLRNVPAALHQQTLQLLLCLQGLLAPACGTDGAHALCQLALQGCACSRLCSPSSGSVLHRACPPCLVTACCSAAGSGLLEGALPAHDDQPGADRVRCAGH